MPTMQLHLAHHPSPIGTLLIATDAQARLRALDFDDRETEMHTWLRLHYGSFELTPGPAPAATLHALDAYFAGELTAIDALAVATGGTPFQRAVWAALRGIPAGCTLSYGELATQLGRAGASRAVGMANNANPISIVVPCHRVIGKNGALTGYGGGLDRKRWLLAHEAQHTPTASAQRLM